MILGDSLQVMASLAEREGLRGKVQCIYIDPPYGIKFNSNFQWSTTNRDVKDGNRKHITREPEQVKAFRDTWRDGIHSYLTYLRDRLTVARDLLTDSGSVFLQIGDENVHYVRALLDETFGKENFITQILFRKTGGLTANFVPTIGDYLLWYAKDRARTKFRRQFRKKNPGDPGATQYTWFLREDQSLAPLSESDKRLKLEKRLVAHADLTSQGNKPYDFRYQDKTFRGGFKPPPKNLERLSKAGRTTIMGNSLRYIRKLSDYDVYEVNHLWEDVGISGFAESKIYVVQTSPFVLQRCVLMTTDPGDLVVDPTCGSGTTPYVAEQWGRRWITIDTSRVALALARARIMGARYPYYLLADSRDGQIKEAELTRKAPSEEPTYNDIRQGFVYERVPHITLKSIANNAEIDVIWKDFQSKLEPIRKKLNGVLGTTWEEWEIPREAGDPWPKPAAKALQRLKRAKASSTKARALTALNNTLNRSYTLNNVPDKPFDLWTNEEAIAYHLQWWKQRIARQKEIDASIAAKADYEYLYDKPYQDKKKVRVAGPFTVDSLSPHRLLGVDENDELIDNIAEAKLGYGEKQDFAGMILEHLKTSGVQQAHKEDKIRFTSLTPWPGDLICGEGTYIEGEMDSGTEKRAGIFIGPEFGTVSRPDLVDAVREAADAAFDVLIACAFNYDAHASELNKLGRVPVLKARMNADLHMAGDLKNTGKGNLFRHLRRAGHRHSQCRGRTNSGQGQRGRCLPS